MAENVLFKNGIVIRGKEKGADHPDPNAVLLTDDDRVIANEAFHNMLTYAECYFDGVEVKPSDVLCYERAKKDFRKAMAMKEHKPLPEPEVLLMHVDVHYFCPECKETEDIRFEAKDEVASGVIARRCECGGLMAYTHARVSQLTT